MGVGFKHASACTHIQYVWRKLLCNEMQIWYYLKNLANRAVTLVKTQLSVREVWGLRPGPVGKSHAVLPMTRHRYDISSDFEAALPRRRAAEMDPTTRNALRSNTFSIMKI